MGMHFSNVPHSGFVSLLSDDTEIVSQEVTDSNWGYIDSSGVYYCFIELWGSAATGLILDYVTLEYVFEDDSLTTLEFGQYNSAKYNLYYRVDSNTASGSSNEECIPEDDPLDDGDDTEDTEDRETIKVGKGKVTAFEIDAYNRPYIAYGTSSADGYLVEFKNEATGKVALSQEVIVTPFQFSTLNNDSLYSVRIKPYKWVDSEKVWGEWSDKRYAISGVSVKEKSKNYITSKSIKLYWNKVKCAKSYEVYYSKYNNKGWKKVGTTKKASFTIKKK